MVKQVIDRITAELPLEGGKNPRGRPYKVGGASSPAARQRARRQRLAESGLVTITANVSVAVAEALEKWIATNEQDKDSAVMAALVKFLDAEPV